MKRKASKLAALVMGVLLIPEMLNLYSEQNPDVTFEVEFVEWGSYWEKLATEAAAGSMISCMHYVQALRHNVFCIIKL